MIRWVDLTGEEKREVIRRLDERPMSVLGLKSGRSYVRGNARRAFQRREARMRRDGAEPCSCLECIALRGDR